MMLWRSPGVGFSFNTCGVGVHHPVNGMIADGVGSYGNTGLMEESYLSGDRHRD